MGARATLLEQRRLPWLLFTLAAVVPLIQIVALALSPSDYTYFIDEFYYISCSKHLALGYVDHPPLAPWLLAVTRLFLGDSLLGIRLLPFLAGGATVWLVGRLAQELGGGRFAVVLAALAFGLSPVLVAMTGFVGLMYLALASRHACRVAHKSARSHGCRVPNTHGGGVALERLVRRPVPRVAAASLVAVSGLLLTPLVLPILPPAAEARYVAFLHANEQAERGKTSPLPQLLADRTGWRSFLGDMSRVYHRLPVDERGRATSTCPTMGTPARSICGVRRQACPA